MTKVAIKNENITSFGGIYHIMDVFSKLGFEKLTESVLGKRGSSGKAFCYGSIFGSLLFSYLCGGKSLDNSLTFSIFASITVCCFVFKISCLRLLIYKDNSTNCYFSIYLFGWETLDNNPIGHKGYFEFLRSHKQFNLEIRLMCAHNSKLTNGKASPFYSPTARQLKEEAWLPTIVVPMNIYMDSDERDLGEKVFDTKLDNISNDAKDYSESNLVSIRSLMDAFGLTDIKTAILDFWWNVKGDSGHDDAGFWF